MIIWHYSLNNKFLIAVLPVRFCKMRWSTYGVSRCYDILLLFFSAMGSFLGSTVYSRNRVSSRKETTVSSFSAFLSQYRPVVCLWVFLSSSRSACLVMLLAGFLKVWLIKLHFLVIMSGNRFLVSYSPLILVGYLLWPVDKKILWWQLLRKVWSL